MENQLVMPATVQVSKAFLIITELLKKSLVKIQVISEKDICNFLYLLLFIFGFVIFKNKIQEWIDKSIFWG